MAAEESQQATYQGQEREHEHNRERETISGEFPKVVAKRREYSYNEDMMILKALVHMEGITKKYSGSLIWKDMAMLPEFVETNRTWQSLKERFRKKISKRLENYGLTDTELSILESNLEVSG